MADTIRTQAQILTLLADNTTGDISPQDHRDQVVSGAVYGGMGMDADTAPTQGSIGTSFIKVTIWDIDLPSSGVVADSTTNNDLTVPTNGAGDYNISLGMTLSGTSSTTFTFEVFVNAAQTTDKAGFSMKVGTGGDVQTCARNWILTLADADVLTAYVKADGASKSITVDYGHLIIRRLK